MAKQVDLALDHACIVTVAGGTGPLFGSRQGELGQVRDGALAVADGRVVAVGPRDAVLDGVEAAHVADLGGRVVLPGFVDAHTHPVWAGHRAGEFEQRLTGVTYLEIMAAGGGIAGTVNATREATDAQLLDKVTERLDRMMDHGTTTIEAKTGYGLSTEEELRQLRVLAEADAASPMHVVPTFLGAHALPVEYAGRADAYIDVIVEEMLPAVAARYPDVFCDVFCDDGAFTLRQTERVLRRAADLGLRLKVHSDEFANLGCTALAAELGASSADHLAATTPAEMDAMALGGTVAVLLPGTTFGLGSSHFADAREMIARDVAVALGTDHNPGTCPCESMQLMLSLATRYMRMTTAEAIVAATRNAAYSCGKGEEAGRIQAGWPADLVVCEGDDYRDLAYRFGGNLVSGVMVDGRWTRLLR